MKQAYISIKSDRLKNFCQKIFQSLGLIEEDALAIADVLVVADMRGIHSHGVARLKLYIDGLKSGVMIADVKAETLMNTRASLVINAHGAMGAPVSIKAMQEVIKKANTNGAAFACVRDSNHFGIAGYYAMMALEKDMIGIAMTNTAALGVPTFGRQVMFGTNALAFAAPADLEKGFILDMSTTVVSRGKIEIYERLRKNIADGWAVDKTGQPATDAHTILDDMLHRRGGGILPLGGAGELFGGYKGYGLAVMVDILCAVLCGAPFGPAVADSEVSFGRVSHFFGAIKIENFRDPKAFRVDMDKLLKDLRNTLPAKGAERVYFAGQKEFEKQAQCLKMGIQLHRSTYDNICALGKEQGINPPPIIST